MRQILVLTAAGITLCTPIASFADGTINDQNGNTFMEEVGSKKPPAKQVTLPQDFSNVGIATDQNGRIIPRINPGSGPVIQTGSSGIQMINEIPALTSPYNSYGMPGGYGTTFVPTGPLMRVPNPYYQQPNINLRVGPIMFGNRPPIYPGYGGAFAPGYGTPYGYGSPYGYGYGPGPFAPPSSLLMPVAPNSTTTYSTPFGSTSVTNTTQSFGPSLVNPLPNLNVKP